MHPLTRIVACAAMLAGCASPQAVPPRPPLLPPMGWNSWNSGIELTEHNVEQTVDAMISSGMRDAGYRYVNLDAGWAAPTRDIEGRLTADSQRFPHGIAALARYVHDRGMLLGIYHSPWNEGCGQDPRIGGAGHEAVDARSFADWGVDYLKYDWCRGDVDHDAQVKYFTAMRDALRAAGRRIFYSINPNSSGDPAAGTSYDWSSIADMSRNSIDVLPAWGDAALWALGRSGIAQSVDNATAVAAQSSPEHINDPDMMVIGIGWNDFARLHPTMSVGPSRPDPTEAEQRAQLSLWAILAAPLLAGNDIRTMSPQTREILTNREVIAVDQDPLVVQGRPQPADPRIIAKPMADGSVAAALVNGEDHDASIGTTAAALGLRRSDCYRVRDLWAHTETTGPGTVGPVVVPPHGVAMLRITRCA